MVVSVSVLYLFVCVAYASKINDVKVENCIGSGDEQAFSPHFYTQYETGCDLNVKRNVHSLVGSPHFWHADNIAVHKFIVPFLICI